MDWLAENGFFALLFVAFIAMHLFGHRHGGHGSHRGRHSAAPAPTATPPLTSCDTIHSSAYTSMLNLRLTAWAAALFATLSFLLCVAFGLVTPGSVHMHQFLEAVLPAFEWISPGSVLLGLVESFLWGAYLGGGFALIYNALYRRWGTPALAGPAASVRSLPTDPTR